MAETDAQFADRFRILCKQCDRPIYVQRAWIGREVECPHCASVLQVPAAPANGQITRAFGPSLRDRHKFNFACVRCGCLLEAHTGMSGQPACCPTCAARLSVPYVNPHTGQPYKPVLLDNGGADPVPLHAYGASGHQAPRIIRRADGTQLIECPRCNGQAPIDAASCASCGAPFTLEAAPTVRSMSRDTHATAACTLGVISLITFFLFVPAVLAIVFGLLSVRSGFGTGRMRGTAVAGIILGILSLATGLALFLL